MRIYIMLFVLATIQSVNAQVYTPKFDVQGHRGARGLKPENTIPAFLTALEFGVTTLELDVVVSADKKIIVSHEPWMYSGICLKPDGSSIAPKEERLYNLYKMSYDSIRLYDCGSIGNVKFPEQEKVQCYKPLLREVIVAVEDFIRSYTHYEVDYNIEIKSTREGDGKFHPAPAEYSDLVYNELIQYLPLGRVVIQSFDIRVLKYWHQKYPEVRLALLVENTKSPAQNISELGFNPSVYSPYFKLLSTEAISFLHQKKIRVIPWTVNEITDIVRLKSWGVDGVITDYPNRTLQLGLGIKRTPMNNSLKKSRPTRN